MAKEFTWNDHPVVEEQNSDKMSGEFNWDAHPVEETPSRTLASEVQAQNQAEVDNRSDVSASRAALVGAGQGATFGFADEITAPVVAAAGMATGLPDEGPEESTWEKYQRLMQVYRDTARDEQKGAQEQQPLAYTGGAVAGGVLSPGLGALKAMKTVKDAGLVAKTAVGAGVGAGMGGLAGLGEAEGTLEERVPEAIDTAKIGAGVGAAIPLVGAGLSSTGKALSKIKEIPVVEDVLKAFNRGVEGQNLITKSGRKQAVDQVREKSGELFDDIKSLQNDIGSKIQDEIASAQESGQKIDLSEEVNDVLSRLQKIKAEGSQEAAAYATSVEKEIKKVLGIKATDDSFMGVASKDLPEGLVVPKAKEVDLTQIDPDKAQTLKQVLSDYTPKKGMAPQQLEPARVAGELKGVSGNKLTDLTENLPELNQQYGLIKDSLKRLGIKENKLPSQIQEKINNVVTRLEKQSTTGDNARQLIEDVLENIKKVDPEMAVRYQDEFKDIVERLNLTDKIIKGGESFSITGTPKALAMGTSNLAGLAVNKTKIVAPVVSNTVNFAKSVLNSPTTDKAVLKYKTQGTDTLQSVRQSAEPYKLQRQVAQASETADPELLKDQANQIREKHGNQGEQLAMILENMASENKDARRALMFTVLQNPAYRKMLGLQNEQK